MGDFPIPGVFSRMGVVATDEANGDRSEADSSRGAIVAWRGRLRAAEGQAQRHGIEQKEHGGACIQEASRIALPMVQLGMVRHVVVPGTQTVTLVSSSLG
jgi:hypothetical protein